MGGTPSPGGLNGSPHAVNLATPFCVGGVNTTINTAGDIPGPAALSLRSNITLLP